jgi:hypothetical protein
MIAARVELRALWGSRWMRAGLPLLATLPVIVMLMAYSIGRVYKQFGYFTFSYPQAMTLAAGLGVATTVLASCSIAIGSHRSNVFQSHVLTGFPRDLILLGRVAAAWVCALAIGAACLVSSMAIHLLTLWPEVFQITYGDGAVVIPLSMWQVVSDIASLFIILVLAATAVVGLVTLTRSVVAAVVVGGLYAVVEQLAVDHARGQWEHDHPRVVPLDRVRDVLASYRDPWWSVEKAGLALTRSPFHERWLSALVLLLVWCAVLCVAAGVRLVRSDA